MSDTPKQPSEDEAELPAEAAAASSSQGSSEGSSDSGSEGRSPKAAGSRKSAKPEAPRRGGGGLGAFALLVALGALGLAGWPWWLAWQGEDDSGRLRSALLEEMQNEIASVEQQQRERLARLEQDQQQRIETAISVQEQRAEERVENLRRRLDRSERELSALLASVESEASSLAEREQELEATVAGLRRAFSDLAGQVVEASPPDSREWQVAEAAYLLRIANQRARLERDLEGASNLLAAADDILAELDDYSLVPVREALVEARAALAAQPAVDRVALYLELESLGLAVDALPMQGPQFRQLEALDDAAAEDAGLLATLERRLGGLFDFRRHRGEQVRPLLTPDASFWRHHNIRLRLSQAQLALLRGEQEVWTGSLTGAAAWIRELPDASALADDAAALAARPVRVTAPDISEPLQRLDAVRRRVPMGANP